MDKALLLLQIQKQAFEAKSVKELGFHMVNATRKLIDYKQAIFWRQGAAGLVLENVSGNALLDQNGPHAQWLKKVLYYELKKFNHNEIFHIVDIAALPNDLRAVWSQYAGASATVMFFRYGPENRIIGGLWIERELSFKDQELHILDELIFYYTRALVLVVKDQTRDFLPLPQRLNRLRKYSWIALLVLALCPVRLSVSAPAELVAVSSMTVSAPFDGLLADIPVRPGDSVTQGDVVAEMDVESLKLQANTSSEAFKAAEIQLARLRREVLSTPEKKTELNRLLSEIKTKEIEARYAEVQLSKAMIQAPRDGIALFADVNDLKGRPVQTGQSIMQIANPAETELLIRIPVQAMIPFHDGAAVSFFPNASPLTNYTADISSIGYQASEDSDGLLTYKVRASLAVKGDDVRIGGKGVAKISGDWTILGYKILRRPLITLRDMMGV